MRWNNGPYEVDTDPERLDLKRVHALLQGSYWAAERLLADVAATFRNSRTCFGVYESSAPGQLVGCARVVSDGVSFGWLADVIIDPEHRGRGAGTFLIACVVQEPEVRRLQRLMLGTRDAQGLYAKFGWQGLPQPDGWMIRPGNTE